LLPVFTAQEMRDLDARAIRDLGIPGPRLMENAGAGAARLITRERGPVRGRRVVIVCGRGNNGGDGFVVARHLRARGARVRVFLVARRADVKGDAAWALGRWRGKVEEILTEDDLGAVGEAVDTADLVVDALLGTGLEGPARGLTARAIDLVNAAQRAVVALDVPSGVSSDGGALPGPAIEARLTATFAGLKRALVMHPAAARAGQVSVVPIGIPPEEVASGIRTFLLEESDIRGYFPARRADVHKGSFGHVLVLAGSVGKTGAAALAGRSSLRSGAGLCTIGTPASQQPVVATLGMEAMTEALAETPGRTLSLAARDLIMELAARVDAVALGPGLSLHPETQALARELVADMPRPMVVDADALTALAGHLDVLGRAAAPRVLTPHPGEMARMLGRTIAEVQADRIETVRAFCVRYGTTVVLKGAGSVIGAPDGRVFVNPTGNAGMATGGAGDVLTGMVGAFLARGLPALSALQAAVFLHGRAGDLACRQWGPEGLIAGDIVEAIPRALVELRTS
jgi:NAD(P)H-hydrate epimerase